jgi:hypothetical protein
MFRPQQPFRGSTVAPLTLGSPGELQSQRSPVSAAVI